MKAGRAGSRSNRADLTKPRCTPFVLLQSEKALQLGFGWQCRRAHVDHVSVLAVSSDWTCQSHQVERQRAEEGAIRHIFLMLVAYDSSCMSSVVSDRRGPGRL